MSDAQPAEDQWYVTATSTKAEEPSRVQKQNDTFGVFDRHDDIFQGEAAGQGDLAQQGLYNEGTRYLSYWELKVNGQIWRGSAERLRQRFNEAFRLDDLDTYALALDGEKRPCRVRTSNAEHSLFSGIALPEYARRVAETLIGKDSFNGWGVRTVANRRAATTPCPTTTARSGPTTTA